MRAASTEQSTLKSSAGVASLIYVFGPHLNDKSQPRGTNAPLLERLTKISKITKGTFRHLNVLPY